jgi:hypothetical protein
MVKDVMSGNDFSTPTHIEPKTPWPLVKLSDGIRRSDSHICVSQTNTGSMLSRQKTYGTPTI